MRIIKKIFKNTIFIILIIILIFVLYSAIQMKVGNNEYSCLFGYTIFEVSTGSMKDTLDIYDIIIVKITQEVEDGDIISYRNDDEIITHRIKSIDGEKIITKGDANNIQDKPITKSDVIGKVVYNLKELGIWIKVFSEIKVVIPMFSGIIFLGLAFSYESKKIIKEGNSKDAE